LRLRRLALAVLGAGLLGSGVHWALQRPGGCPGTVGIALEPPLLGPADYRFELTLDGERCDFSLRLAAELVMGPRPCPLVRRLEVGGQSTHPGIEGFSLAGLPERLHLRVLRDAELVYDAAFEPAAPGAPRADAPRDGDARLCGPSVRWRPDCLPGSSQCTPYPVSCRGPAECPAAALCCATPDWARRYGSRYAMQCTTLEECSSRIESFVVCGDGGDCPAGLRCGPLAPLAVYAEPLRGCAPSSSP
jgi:hypothetical protein